jgi:hypothetical protein
VSKHKRCVHGKRRGICRDCGGGSFCKHNRQRQTCKPCRGGSVCEHNRLRHACSVCNPEGVYKVYKREAPKRGLTFSITLEEFKTLVSKPCFYCGEDEHPRGADRLDNKRGYEANNCRPSCGPCNMLKRNFGLQKFIEVCCRVAAHWFPTG